MNNLDAIYVDVDDFCLLFEPQWQAHLIETGEKQRLFAKNTIQKLRR